MCIGQMSKKEASRMLYKQGWQRSSIRKFESVGINNPTALRILNQFEGYEWRVFQASKRIEPLWEYMVLLKLVHAGLLIAFPMKHKGRFRLAFIRPLSTLFACHEVK